MELNHIEEYKWRLLFLVAFFHGLVYAVMMPPWSITDEQQHFDYAEQLATGNGLPVAGVTLLLPEVAQAVYESNRWEKFGWPKRAGADPKEWGLEGLSYEAHQPPVFYAALSLILRTLPGNVSDRLFFSRILLVLLGLGVVIFLKKTMLTIWPARNDLAYWACLLLAIIPERAQTISRVGNDGLAELLGAILVFSLALATIRGLNVKLAAIIGLTFGLALLTKMTTLCLALPIALLFWLRKGDLEFVRSLVVISVAGFSVLLLVITAGWSPFETIGAASNWGSIRNYDSNMQDIKWFFQNIIKLFQGFWFYGNFWDTWRNSGQKNFILSSFVFIGFGVIASVSVFNLIRKFISERSKFDLPTQILLTYGLTLLFAVSTILALSKFQFIPGAPGRLLLPYITIIIALFVGGLSKKIGESLLIASVVLLIVIGIAWLTIGQIYAYYWISPYAISILAENSTNSILDLFQVIYSDKPMWVRPIIPVALIGYLGTIAILGVSMFIRLVQAFKS